MQARGGRGTEIQKYDHKILNEANELLSAVVINANASPLRDLINLIVEYNENMKGEKKAIHCCEDNIALNPFRTAVPFWGQIT